MIYFIFFVFLFLGFIFGSFLNVVSLRYNTGRSLGGRSMCFSCKKILVWYELIPVFSWLTQKGRCRSCSSKIPKELFISEILTGIIFALIAVRGFFIDSFVLNTAYLISTFYILVIFSILIVILFYDIRHKIIPDGLSFSFAIISFLGLFFFGFSQDIFVFIGFHVPEIVNIFAGIIVASPFFFIWLFSKGRLMGLGDPKLMMGIGFLLGLSRGFSAIFISFWVGAVYAFFLVIIERFFRNKLLVSGKKGIMKTEIPFAPFLILGTFIVLVFGVNVFFLL